MILNIFQKKPKKYSNTNENCVTIAERHFKYKTRKVSRKFYETVEKATGDNQEKQALNLGYKKNYLSDMLTPTGKVSAKALDKFKLYYKEVLSENTKRSKGYDLPIIKDYILNDTETPDILNRIEANLEYSISRILMNEALLRTGLYRQAQQDARSTGQDYKDIMKQVNEAAATIFDDIFQKSGLIAKQGRRKKQKAFDDGFS